MTMHESTGVCLNNRKLRLHRNMQGQVGPLSAKSTITPTRSSIRGACYGHAAEVKRRSVCILFLWLLLHSATAFSTENPDVQSLEQKVTELYNAGKSAGAIPLAEQVLAYKESVLGPENPDTAKSLNDLAELYHQTHDYAKAEPLFQRALKIREKVFDPDDAYTAFSLNNLAKLHQDMGDYVTAAPLFHRTLAIYEKVLGL